MPNPMAMANEQAECMNAYRKHKAERSRRTKDGGMSPSLSKANLYVSRGFLTVL